MTDTIFVGPTTWTTSLVPSHTCTINLVQTGSQVDGRDQAAMFAANDKIYLHMLWTSGGVRTGLIASKLPGLSSTLPPGANSSTKLLSVLLDGNGAMRQQTANLFFINAISPQVSVSNAEVFFDNALNETNVLSSGTAVDTTPTTQVDCSGIVPSEAVTMTLLVSTSPNTVIGTFGYVSGQSHAEVINQLMTIKIPTARNGEKFYYANSGAGGSSSAWVLGYTM